MGLLSKTTSEIEEALEKANNIETTFDTMFAQKMLSIYPVGAIYMSVSSTSPASLFGGTWEQIQNRFLLAAGVPMRLVRLAAKLRTPWRWRKCQPIVIVSPIR